MMYNMFDEFLKNCPMQDKIKPSKKRVRNNIAAVNSLIETEEGTMTKRKYRLKPLVITAVVMILSAVSLLTVNAATKGAVVRFFMGDKEIEGEYYDYVDDEGFRHISFGAQIPIKADDFAIIYDVDAPQGENVRVITEETDPDFIAKLRLYKEADFNVSEAAKNAAKQKESSGSTASVNYSDKYTPLKPEDFGIIIKDSELCTCYLTSAGSSYNAYLGGEFMNVETDFEFSGGYKEEFKSFDYMRGTKTFKATFYYYVGKE